MGSLVRDRGTPMRRYDPVVSSSGAYRDVLQIRDARALIAASAASQLGDWLYNAALLAYVYIATGSAAWVGAATICRLLPYALLGPFGGVVADRYDRRSVLLVGDVIRAALMFVLAAAVAGHAAILLVIAVTTLSSVAGAAERPAAMALMPRLVGESRLGPANALLHTVQELGVVVGPAIGAILLTVSPSWVAFLVNGFTFLLSALFISTMRSRPVTAASAQQEAATAQLRLGLVTVRTTAFVVPLFVIVAMAELTYGAQTVQLVLYADQSLGLGAEGYGYLLAATGLGGLLSVLVNARLSTSTKVTRIAIITGIMFCATQLVYAASERVAVALVVTVVGGVGLVACEVVVETTLARVVSADLLGRVMGFYDSMSVAAMVAGAVLAPVLVSLTSLRTSLLVMGVAAVLVTLLCATGLRGLDARSRARADLLASRVAVIEQVPLTQGVPRIVLEELAAASQLCPLPPGVDVVVQGAPAHAFYVVVDGEVVVHRDGDEVIRLRGGEWFGERGLLDGAARNATVTTSLDSTVLRLEGSVLMDALEAAPTLRSELALGGRRPGTAVTATALVDDPRWAAS
jgi:MFS family permease